MGKWYLVNLEINPDALLKLVRLYYFLYLPFRIAVTQQN